MKQQTLGQSRVGVDPLLTSVAQGYTNASAAGMALFPAVEVLKRGGKIVAFGKEDFQSYQTFRAPGANTKRVQFGFASGGYTLEQHALEAMVPWELAEDAAAAGQAGRGKRLQDVAVRRVQNILSLRLEMAQAAIATNAALYGAGNKVTLAGTAQWSDFSGTSNPSNDIETAKDAVRSQIGAYPNTVLLSAQAMRACRRHPAITDRIKYTSAARTEELLAALWGVERVVVGAAMYQDPSGTFQDTWGKFVVVAYTAIAGTEAVGEPSFGYTYRLAGAPYVEERYSDDVVKSDVLPVTDEVVAVMAAPLSGYLISAAVA